MNDYGAIDENDVIHLRTLRLEIITNKERTPTIITHTNKRKDNSVLTVAYEFFMRPCPLTPKINIETASI